MGKKNRRSASQRGNSSPDAAPAPFSNQSLCTGGLGLVVLIFWAFSPVFANGFINFDDPLYVTANKHVQGGFTQQSIGWAFTATEGGLWHPLTWLSLALDFSMFGGQAAGFHLTSLLLHTANGLLLFVILCRTTRLIKPSWLVAALFAVHPLHVESVAWVAERKDVLSTFFWMLTILCYVRFVEARNLGEGKLFYVLAVANFAFGLMSKAMIVTLPFVLLLLDFWPLRRMTDFRSDIWKLLFEKTPFLVGSLVFAISACFTQRSAGALTNVGELNLAARLANAALSYFRYLGQTVWPVNLSVFYPFTTDGATFGVGAALLLIVVTFFVLKAWRLGPWLAVGWLWYVITLLPVIGLVPIGGQSHADRYTYVPLIGIFISVVWQLQMLAHRRRSWAFILPTVAVLLGLAFLSRRQVAYWHDTELLFTHAVQIRSDNELAHNQLGVEFNRQGRHELAIAHLQKALAVFPNYADAHNNLGVVLGKLGRLDEALEHFEKAVRLRPELADTYCNWGDALALRERLPEATKAYETAVVLNPKEPAGHGGLARVCGAMGKLDEGIAHFRRAIELDSGRAEFHFGMGLLLAGKNQFEAATGSLREALRLDPNLAEAHANLGIVLGRLGRLDEAIAELEIGVRLKPDYAEAQKNLALARQLKAAR